MIDEKSSLASYASKSETSRGRKFPEPKHTYRTEFQRDRERIIHSRAFRRLENKTQVFINPEADHYRTRLTHTIEVSQIARTIARVLNLNEDLTESISLAHDLGHTPFGHAGERELNRIMSNNGGFEHNRQSLRIVDLLEKSYSNFDGLNLTWETREGLIKHSLTTAINYKEYPEFEPNKCASLEAQIIDLADEIAYNNHDLDDGVSSKILRMDDITSLKIWQIALKHNKNINPKTEKLFLREMIRIIINLLVTDLISTTNNNIAENHIFSLEDVRDCDKKCVCFSGEVYEANQEFKLFLKNNFYRHSKIMEMSQIAERCIRELFEIYSTDTSKLPAVYDDKLQRDGTMLTVCDYIAGMTDRYAFDEHKKLTNKSIV
jgi:dGTPase